MVCPVPAVLLVKKAGQVSLEPQALRVLGASRALTVQRGETALQAALAAEESREPREKWVSLDCLEGLVVPALLVVEGLQDWPAQTGRTE